MAGGLRFNEGKLRYDLVNPEAHEGMVQILTKGAQKYAPRNWEKGMEWSKITSSLKRHLAAYEKGEDYDPETGLLHADHIACNAHFLSAYYRIYPQGDDRPHSWLQTTKIGLDIDGVLADFSGHLMKVSGHEGHIALHWNDPIVRAEFDKIKTDKDFWLSIPALLTPVDMPFEPHCYITARSIAPEVTQEWLNKSGFPKAKLYCVGVGESKVETAKAAGVEIFVDDSYDNFVELTNGGIFTYLYDAPYNQHYNVGHKRIKSLSEIV